MMKQLILSTSFILLISSLAAQAESKYETDYAKCADEAGTMNNGVMAACSESVSETAKQDINAYYQQVEKKIASYDNKAELLKQLETSQKAWIQYRNTHCALSEMLAEHEPYCLMLVNAQRADELKALAE